MDGEKGFDFPLRVSVASGKLKKAHGFCGVRL